MPTGDSKLDAFESLFRSAMKEVFHLDPPAVEDVLLLGDGTEDLRPLQESLRGFLSRIDSAEHLKITVETDWANEPSPVMAAKALVEARRPDVVACRRHLGDRSKNLSYTLGSVVDTLSQATLTPVLLLPPPNTPLPSGTHRVMVVTDHLTGDDRLVNMGVQFTHRSGTLFLAHIEERGMLEYYLNAIDKMASIDSARARSELPERLLKDPRDYIGSVADVLARAGIDETVVPLVQHGSGVTAYQQLLAEHDVDLLIFNAKNDRQDAMNAMAHAIAVQLRSRPLLLL